MIRALAIAAAAVAAAASGCGGKKDDATGTGAATASGTAAPADPRAALAAMALDAAAGKPTASAAAYDRTARVHPVLVGDGAWSAALPEAWRATDPAKVELVAVLLDETSFDIGSAEYRGSTAPGAPTTRVSRSVKARRVRLLEARTGTVVADDYLVGPPPRDLRSIESSAVVSGPELTADDLKAWLEPFATGGASAGTMIGRTPDGSARLALSPDGTRIAVGTTDTTVVLHRLPGLEAERTITLKGTSNLEHRLSAQGAFDATGTHLVVGGDDDQLAVIDLASGAERVIPLAKTMMGFSYRADHLCVAGGGVLTREPYGTEWRVLALADGKKLGKVSIDAAAGDDCVVSPTGAHVLVAVGQTGFALVDTRAWKNQVAVYSASNDSVSGFAFAPDGATFVVGYGSGQIHRHSVAKPKAVPAASLATMGSAISSLAYTPDGKHLVVADGDGIHLRDATSGAEVALLSKIPFATDLAVTKDGAHVVGTTGFAASQRWAFVIRLAAA